MDMIPKTQATKAKIGKQDYLIFVNFCMSKEINIVKGNL
jgi:hypothetical protein